MKDVPLKWSDIANRFVADEYGVHHSARGQAVVSYPEDGNKNCFRVEDHSLWFRHRNRCIAEAMRQYPPAQPLFDIGGGNGYVSQHLWSAGIECVLVEPGSAGAYNARVHRKLPHVVCSTTSELTFLNGKIPSIGIFDVLEHIEDDNLFMRQLHDLLVPGGRIYLTVPAHQFLWSDADVKAQHYRRYSHKALHDVLCRAGFQIEYHTGIFGPLIPAIFILRSLVSCWGRRIKANANKTERQHGMQGGLGWRFTSLLMQRDLRAIRRQKSIVGASLLFVASKANESNS